MMFAKRVPSLLARAVFFATAFAGSIVAFAQATPKPPSSICVQDNTGANSCAQDLVPGVGAKKWTPGHYVRPNAVGFVTNAADRAYQFEKIRNEPLIKGGLISVPWGSIEPAEGVYNFAPIDADLALMKSMGKKLIIEVWWQKYGGSADTRYFPQYIMDAGGIGEIVSPSEHHVKINEARWSDRYFALQRALAAKYDNDPAVEQVVITETASTSAYAFLDLLPKVNALWPHTAVVLYANWVDRAELARDLLKLMSQIGAGVGAPDIVGPPGFNYEDHGSQALRGVGVKPLYGGTSAPGDFGTVDYRGKIPVAYQYQAFGGVAASQIFSYATNTLKATHLIWTMTEDSTSGVNWSTGILPLIKSVNGSVVTAYPSAMPK